jgi:hypothetical protein
MRSGPDFRKGSLRITVYNITLKSHYIKILRGTIPFLLDKRNVDCPYSCLLYPPIS